MIKSKSLKWMGCNTWKLEVNAKFRLRNSREKNWWETKGTDA
jgi:hypothetical protein